MTPEATADSERIDSLDWSVRPLRDRPGRLALILAVALLAFAFGVFFFSQLLMGVLGFAMILGSTMDHWLGASFHLDSDRARSRVGASVTEIRWPNVKRILVEERSIRLSPLDKSSRLDPFRGVELRTANGNHSEVLEFVRRHSPAGAIHQAQATKADKDA